MQSYNFLTRLSANIVGKGTKLVAAQRTATDLLKAYFASTEDRTTSVSSTLISTPTYSVTSEKAVVIQLFSYESPTKTPGHVPAKTSSKLTDSSLNSLVAALSRLFSAPAGNIVPVQLRIVRLHHPYLNSSILAQFLAMNASKYGFALSYSTDYLFYLYPVRPI
jgi:hypothetical protein